MDPEALRTAGIPNVDENSPILPQILLEHWGVNVDCENGGIKPLDSYVDKNFRVVGEKGGSVETFTLKMMNGFDSKDMPMLSFHNLQIG